MKLYEIFKTGTSPISTLAYQAINKISNANIDSTITTSGISALKNIINQPSVFVDDSQQLVININNAISSPTPANVQGIIDVITGYIRSED